MMDECNEIHLRAVKWKNQPSIKLNEGKCKFQINESKYFGYIMKQGDKT